MTTCEKEIPSVLSDFISLVDGFLDHELSAESFERKYLTFRRRFHQTKWNFEKEELNFLEDIIDSIFLSVDAYCVDDSLRDQYDIDENSFRCEVKKKRKLFREKFDL